ncbi:MAG TPA: hypothetical protein DD001_14950 [Microcoleaceae bacterium UBA10368]|nr:hypothetical protein [Microcoleaceae cyanobacterium UBA10368]HCV29927.1 hypothetical protein [Microcoleaceae cyanobacterium UBA9251]
MRAKLAGKSWESVRIFSCTLRILIETFKPIRAIGKAKNKCDKRNKRSPNLSPFFIFQATFSVPPDVINY